MVLPLYEKIELGYPFVDRIPQYHFVEILFQFSFSIGIFFYILYSFRLTFFYFLDNIFLIFDVFFLYS
ncbi:unnamed protein product [Meloidogyne enterolobii]|uniref:Uncharacterized protein n=1 Tax=Meloidogyne enterolobii TaxID=390850 RepID=A0ACB0YF19_MELEN